MTRPDWAPVPGCECRAGWVPPSRRRQAARKEQDPVDAGHRVGQKDLIQAPDRRDRVRELVAVDENSRQRKLGISRGPWVSRPNA